MQTNVCTRFQRVVVSPAPGESSTQNCDRGTPSGCVTRRRRKMKKQLRWSALALAMVVFAACADSGADPTTTAGEAPTTTEGAAPSTTAGPAETTTSAASELVVACDTTVPSDAPGAMTMWERSGGNGQMVDALVCAWNDRNPDRAINLEYIEHTDMVSRLATGLASGDVPDLMGLDLIYGPQFTSAASFRRSRE